MRGSANGGLQWQRQQLWAGRAADGGDLGRVNAVVDGAALGFVRASIGGIEHYVNAREAPTGGEAVELLEGGLHAGAGCDGVDGGGRREDVIEGVQAGAGGSGEHAIGGAGAQHGNRRGIAVDGAGVIGEHTHEGDARVGDGLRRTGGGSGDLGCGASGGGAVAVSSASALSRQSAVATNSGR